MGVVRRLEFKPVTQRDLARLRRYYKNCSYGLCEYSAMVKLMWREHLHPAWAEAAGCLVVRNWRSLSSPRKRRRGCWRVIRFCM